MNSHKMTKKSGVTSKQPLHKCDHCDFTSKVHVSLILHCKEVHDIEL